MPFAREGIGRGDGGLVGSVTPPRTSGRRSDPEVRARTRAGPPGVDVERFQPLPADEAKAACRGLAAARRGRRRAAVRPRRPRRRRAAGWAGGRRPAVLFVGKFLVNKGVDLLAAAWPLVHRDQPGRRLLLVGFGAFRPGSSAPRRRSRRGDLDAAARLAARGAARGRGGRRGLPASSPPSSPEPPGRATGRGRRGRRARSPSAAGSSTTSRGRVAPAADALVMPSTFPEAFGMVAAEAAACGRCRLRRPLRDARGLAGSRGGGRPTVARCSPSRSEAGPGDRRAADRVARDRRRAAARGRRALAARAAELWSWEGVAGA